MHQKCYRCKTPFFENSIQYNKRTKVVTKVIILSAPICKDCNRIKLAGEKENERNQLNILAIEEMCKQKHLTHDEQLYAKAVQIKKEFGHVSNPLLQRKLQINYEKAATILEKLNNEEKI